ncbi:hypothetical protein K3495_g12252 [Podosphaera aphanis]|nr:hypothetical protein K3495_g12252 [Podosphaera aphanis]
MTAGNLTSYGEYFGDCDSIEMARSWEPDYWTPDHLPLDWYSSK